MLHEKFNYIKFLDNLISVEELNDQRVDNNTYYYIFLDKSDNYLEDKHDYI